MEKEELKIILKQLIKKNPLSYFNSIRKNKAFSEIKNALFQYTPLLIDDNKFTYSIPTRVYWIINDMDKFKKCPKCGKNIGEKENIVLKKGYRKTCSNKECRYKTMQESIEKTNLSKYGVKSVFQIKESIDKSRETKLKKYGIDNFVNPNKAKHTKLERYGNENYSNREKSKKTCLEKYGVDHPLKSSIIQEKVKQTCLEKYGTITFLNSDIGKEKTKQICLEKYGVENYSQTDAFKTKILQQRRNKMFLKVLNNQNIIFSSKNNMISTDFFDLNKEYIWKCKKCGNEFKAKLDRNFYNRFNFPVRCEICYPKTLPISNEEKDIVLFLKENFQSDIIENIKKVIPPLELDIYIPSKKLAIEFDGLYWHSEYHEINKNYHLYKTEECEKQGIQLIHIFEDEWEFKQDIVKSRLKNLLGIYDNKCYARQCEVKEVDSKTSFSFQEENHIQGAVNSKVNFGLYFKDELISLMTFSKPRFDKKHEWELVRFCNKLGWHIPGAASKLLTHFENKYHPKNIVSYADRRWSKGNVYEKLGFSLDHISPPDYFYIKNGIRESRVKYQKHKLPQLLEKFDPKKTEAENMFENDYSRIWDCGNLVFVKGV